MSIVFNKGITVLETLQKLLMNITTANDFNITIRNVFLYDVSSFEATANALLPVMLIQAGEIIERDTNEEFESEMEVEIFIRYQPEDQHNGIVTDFSKILTAIGTQLDTNGCLNLDFVTKAHISAIEHPLYLEKRQDFRFKITIDIDYFYDANDP